MLFDTIKQQVQRPDAPALCGMPRDKLSPPLLGFGDVEEQCRFLATREEEGFRPQRHIL